jgi:hypothetical protein
LSKWVAALPAQKWGMIISSDGRGNSMTQSNGDDDDVIVIDIDVWGIPLAYLLPKDVTMYKIRNFESSVVVVVVAVVGVAEE